MNRQEEVIQHVCETVGIAFRSIGNYSVASDCFCSEATHPEYFKHSGETLEFVRLAVLEKLERDGFDVKMGETGPVDHAEIYELMKNSSYKESPND